MVELEFITFIVFVTVTAVVDQEAGFIVLTVLLHSGFALEVLSSPTLGIMQFEILIQFLLIV